MNITIINGCENNTLLEYEVVDRISSFIEDKNVKYSINNLTEIQPKSCLGCDSCQNINPGVCVINDGINEILKQYLNSDKSVIISPIQFGCYNSITKNFIDRTEPFFLPYQICKNGRTIMKPRYENYPDIIFVGIIEDEDSDSIQIFKDTVLNCTLSQVSNKVQVKIIQRKADINNFEELVLI